MVGAPDRAYAADMTTARPRPVDRVLPGLARFAWSEPRAAGPVRPPAYDLAVAALLAVVAVGGSYAEAHPSQAHNYFTPPHHLPHTPTAAMLLVLSAGMVLAWRRRYPRLTLCVTTALVVAYSAPGYVNGTAVLLPAMALGLLAARGQPVRSAAWAVAVTIALMAATGPNNPLGWSGGSFLIIPMDIAIALFAGIALASRRAYVESVRAETERHAAQEAQRSVDEERLRIARELHDVVAHTMATITVQAAAATQLLPGRPDEAADSLRAIRAASKEGLRELRAILNVLRAASDSDESGQPNQPAPGLSRLDALLGGVRAAGLPVTATATGRRPDLAAVTDLSAFRIIQEALTNTLRHAGPASAVVTVHYAADALLIEVTDTGRGLIGPAAEAAYASFLVGAGAPVTADADYDRLAGGQGHGLRGMRERAAAAGGAVEAGPRAEGGFRVAATLPFSPPPVPQAPPADPGPDAALPAVRPPAAPSPAARPPANEEAKR
jgi:signal transduction histidine kinase